MIVRQSAAWESARAVSKHLDTSHLVDAICNAVIAADSSASEKGNTIMGQVIARCCNVCAPDISSDSDDRTSAYGGAMAAANG